MLFCLQDAFVKWNSWTEAENYLLVEKLVSKTEQEEWKEMATMVDKSDTYATQAYKCKAMRKYASYYGVPMESVKIEDVAKSPHGIRGWAEMSVIVPGVNDKDKDDASSAKTPKPKGGAKAKAKAKAKALTDGVDDSAAAGEEQSGGDPNEQPAPRRGSGGKRVKKEMTTTQVNEGKSKEMMAQIQKSQQIMDKIAAYGDGIPSEWKWAKGFLQEYLDLSKDMKSALENQGGEDLTEFVDQLKLCMIDKSGLKTLKKNLGDTYGQLLTLFVDRCASLAAQNLGLKF